MHRADSRKTTQKWFAAIGSLILAGAIVLAGLGFALGILGFYLPSEAATRAACRQPLMPTASLATLVSHVACIMLHGQWQLPALKLASDGNSQGHHNICCPQFDAAY